MSKCSEPEETRDYLCVGPLAWGRANSIKKAQRLCVANIGVKLQGPDVQHCVVWELFSDDVGINESGALNWLEGDKPPVIVWMGSEFSARNPGRSVGQSDGASNG